jgi:hypothetical protein
MMVVVSTAGNPPIPWLIITWVAFLRPASLALVLKELESGTRKYIPSLAHGKNQVRLSCQRLSKSI